MPNNETVTRWYLYNMKQSVIDDINLYAAEHKARTGEKIGNADVVERAMAALRREEKKKYDPNFGDNRICECGHQYHRHFDSWDDMKPAGCKYCGCVEFKEAKDKS